MNFSQVRKALKDAGTAQNRKVYGRHGVGSKMYGVSFAKLNKLAKRIKIDHALALQLWATGNHDARILATKIADPAELKSGQLDSWAKELDNYVITDAFASMVGRTELAEAKVKKWTRSKQDSVGQAGYNLLAALASAENDLKPGYFLDHLKRVEQRIHKSPNRTRHSMNLALICIGLRSPSLRKRAEAAARRIGPVEVDHGETSCKTPEAISYIAKTVARREARARKR